MYSAPLSQKLTKNIMKLMEIQSNISTDQAYLHLLLQPLKHCLIRIKYCKSFSEDSTGFIQASSLPEGLKQREAKGPQISRAATSLLPLVGSSDRILEATPSIVISLSAIAIETMKRSVLYVP